MRLAEHQCACGYCGDQAPFAGARAMSYLRQNLKVIAVGLTFGGLLEYGLIQGKFYDQMRNSRANHLAEDWDALEKDPHARAKVVAVETRYREIINSSSSSSSGASASSKH